MKLINLEYWSQFQTTICLSQILFADRGYRDFRIYIEKMKLSTIRYMSIWITQLER